MSRSSSRRSGKGQRSKSGSPSRTILSVGDPCVRTHKDVLETEPSASYSASGEVEEERDRHKEQSGGLEIHGPTLPATNPEITFAQHPPTNSQSPAESSRPPVQTTQRQEAQVDRSSSKSLKDAARPVEDEAASAQDHDIPVALSDPKQEKETTVPAKLWKKQDSDQAWEQVVEVMTKYDDKMVGGWKDELSNLLVFAGLFSAVVTAFSIVSYNFLQPDQAARSVEVLERISLQLSSFSTNTVFINSTMPALPSSNFAASTTDIIINVLWFLSLTLALMAALFALLAQQWIRQYADLPLVAGAKRARIRHRRFESLDRWFVPQIIVSLGLLLQAALFLFFSGLVVLLWRTNPTVAKATTSTVAFFISAFLLTTIIPPLYPDCPYKSPLALGIRFSVLIATIPPLYCLGVVLKLWDVAFGSNSWDWWDKWTDQRFVWQHNWHTVEEETFEMLDKDQLDYRSIIWTARTGTSANMDNLSSYLLDIGGPYKALINLVALSTGWKLDRVLGRMQNEEVTPYRIFIQPTAQSMASALMLNASAQLEHASHNREQKLSSDATEEMLRLVNTVMWINDLGHPKLDGYIWSWSYLSAAVKALNVVEHTHHLVRMLNRTFNTSRIQLWDLDPLEPVFLFLSSVATSHWFWDLYHALDLASLAQSSEPGLLGAERLSTLATAFELVAIASIYEVRRGYRLDAPAHSMLHGPSGQDERKRRWDAIKLYFQCPANRHYRKDGNDMQWFNALDWLLFIALNPRAQDRHSANPAIIIHKELSELVDACIAGGVLDKTQIGWRVSDLLDFLKSAAPHVVESSDGLPYPGSAEPYRSSIRSAVQIT